MIRSVFAVLVAAALLGASPVPSPSSPASTGGGSYKIGVWTVMTSPLDANFKSGDFSAPKKVHMTREGGDIVADRADGNYKTKLIYLYGHVVMHDAEGNFSGIASAKGSRSRGPATLTADKVQIDGSAKVYTATGNVHYVQADTIVDADKGVLHDVTHELDLTGHVHIVQGDRTMTADHVLYNTITGQAHAEGNVTMQFPSELNPHFATPRPIHIPNPLERHKPAPAPSHAP